MPPAPWESYTLPDIWKMLRHESTCTGADRILDWDALTHDLRTQHHRLTEARADLAAAWPPDKNTSARAFLDHIDRLTESMQQTLTRAEDTRAGLRGIIEAISEAQLTVQPLIEQRTGVSEDLIPRWADHAEDEYDAKAREAMRIAEAAIADHSSQIQAPELFDTGGIAEGKGKDLPGDERAIGLQGSDGGGRATPIPVAVPHNPPAVALEPGRDPGGSHTDPTSGGPNLGSSPELAGVLLPSTVPAPSGTTPSSAAAPGGGAQSVGGLPAPGIPPNFGFGRPIGGSKSTPANRRAVSIRTAMPSGTVIGANGSGGMRGTPGQPMIGHQPTGRPKSKRESKGVEGKQDQSWAAPQGVAPVIRPKRRAPRHEPGPGVIGLDR